MKKDDIWVVRYGTKWALRWDGNTKVIPRSIYNTKKDASNKAKELTTGQISIQLVDYILGYSLYD